jgi:uncharacterized membrane protein YqjE
MIGYSRLELESPSSGDDMTSTTNDSQAGEAGPRARAAAALRRLSSGGRPTVGVGAAGKAVAEDVSALVKAHVDLAKAELSRGLKEKGAGAGAFGAAGILGWLGLQGLLITIGFVLAIWLPGWAAAAIVTAVLLIAAAIAALIGRGKMRTPVTLDVTKSALDADVAVVRTQLSSKGAP